MSDPGSKRQYVPLLVLLVVAFGAIALGSGFASEFDAGSLSPANDSTNESNSDAAGTVIETNETNETTPTSTAESTTTPATTTDAPPSDGDDNTTDESDAGNSNDNAGSSSNSDSNSNSNDADDSNSGNDGSAGDATTTTSTPTETSSPVETTETPTSEPPSVQPLTDVSNQCGQLTVSNPNEFAVTYSYTVQETNEGDQVQLGPGESMTIDLDLSGSEGDQYYVVTEAVRSDTGELVPVEDESTSAITESVQVCGSSETTTSTPTETPTETSTPTSSVEPLTDASNQCGQLTVSNPNEFAVTYSYTVQEASMSGNVELGPGESTTIDLDLSGPEGEQYYVVTEAAQSDTGESVPVEDEETSAITESVEACGSTQTTTETATSSPTTEMTTETTTETSTTTALTTETETATETTETLQTQTTESQSTESQTETQTAEATESQTETATPTDSDTTTTTETESASFATLLPGTRFGATLSCLLAIAGLSVRRRHR
ncbi:hypothetical protein [Haloprofundus salilacus]|uniref:hypothetical protein n=1 Tax=Haloprofundus salilacus TaxID=2876190 RepID=UPI001CCDD380|nr:hypothetical protein [Haloprofundus salilacus]